jgi:FMN phosphatase YigB (HAD superfamily)
VAADRAGLAAALAELGEDAIIQEVVRAPELTVDAFFDLEGCAITCVPRERVAVVAGESVISRTVADPDLAASAIRLAAAVGLVGHVTIQAFRTPDAILFIEINPRYGGAANLGFEAGARTPELAIRLARGETLEPQLDAFEPDLVMLRSGADRFIRAREIIGADARPARGSRGVLFDLDDTLYPERQFVDGGFHAAARTIRAALASAQGQDEDELVDRLWQLHAEAGRGRLFDRLIEQITGAPAEPALVLACLHAYRTHEPHLTPVRGIDRLLGELERRGVPLGLVSDGLASVQRRKLDALPSIRGRFGAIVMTDELGPGHAKPAPEGFMLACRLLGVAPADAVYVANDARKDFRGARAAGLATIRFGSAPDEGGQAGGRGVDSPVDPADDSDHRADTVDELARLLAPLPGSPIAGLTE